MCCKGGGGGGRNLAGEAAEVGRGSAGGPGEPRRSQGGGRGDQKVSPVGRHGCLCDLGSPMLVVSRGLCCAPFPLLEEPDWPLGLWTAWKDSFGLPKA